MNYAEMSDDQLAQIIWDFNTQRDQVGLADIILVLGNNDIRVGQRGAELFLQGLAPHLIFSGKSGRLTKEWDKSEAEVFADEAMKMGVPKEKILIENQSTNTSENITFTQKLLSEQKISGDTYIIVTKPQMLQRAYAVCKKLLPTKKLFFTAPQITFEEYPNDVLPKDLLINNLVGALQRIFIYPEKGFQVAIDVPVSVKAAYEELIKRGYTQLLTQT